jgi:hypothetical protein
MTTEPTDRASVARFLAEATAPVGADEPGTDARVLAHAFWQWAQVSGQPVPPTFAALYSLFGDLTERRRPQGERVSFAVRLLTAPTWTPPARRRRRRSR